MHKLPDGIASKRKGVPDGTDSKSSTPLIGAATAGVQSITISRYRRDTRPQPIREGYQIVVNVRVSISMP